MALWSGRLWHFGRCLSGTLVVVEQIELDDGRRPVDSELARTRPGNPVVIAGRPSWSFGPPSSENPEASKGIRRTFDRPDLVARLLCDRLVSKPSFAIAGVVINRDQNGLHCRRRDGAVASPALREQHNGWKPEPPEAIRTLLPCWRLPARLVRVLLMLFGNWHSCHNWAIRLSQDGIREGLRGVCPAGLRHALVLVVGNQPRSRRPATIG